MTTIKYTKDHEYVRVDDGTGAVGITNHAQEKLGDITYAEVPQVGRAVKRGEAVGVVESVKAASDVYSPVSGTITEINAALADRPELINADAEGGAWFFKLTLSDPAELDGLMDKDDYLAYAAEQA